MKGEGSSMIIVKSDVSSWEQFHSASSEEGEVTDTGGREGAQSPIRNLIQGGTQRKRQQAETRDSWRQCLQDAAFLPSAGTAMLR